MIILILILVLITALLAGLLVRQRSATASVRKTLDERLVFEEILEKLSKTFVNIPPEKVDGAIDDAIKMVCDRMDFDIATLWEWTSDEKRYFTITHLYRPLGGPPVPPDINGDDAFPWCISEFKAGRIVAVSTDDLPPEAAPDREAWEYYGIKSSASFPLSTGNEPFAGVLGFNTTRERRPWSPDVLKALQLVAEIFANALVRKISNQALHESEERLSVASTAAGAGVWILDPQTQLFWGNPQVLELFGFPPGQLVSVDTFLAKVHPEDRALVYEALRRSSALNEDVQVEYRVVDPDGTIRWIAARGRRQLNPSGGIARVMGISFDITERKKAGAVAEEIQSTITAIIESTEDLIWSVDCERFGLLTFNTALSEYFRQGVGVPITRGMNPEDMVGGTFTPQFAAKWRSFYERALREGPYTEEYATSAGTKTLLLSLTLLKRDGKLFGVSVFGKDITERKRMAEELAAASQEWQSTFDSIPDLVMILDREHRVVQANAAVGLFLGLPEDRITGQNWHTLIHGDDHSASPAEMLGYLKKHEEETIYAEKWQKWLAISIDPIFDENENIARLVLTIKDMTEQKKNETEAMNSRREMLRMERVLRMGELTASLAHELNQPLTSILNNARAALRFLDSGALAEDELRDILNDIATDDKRAGDIIRSLRSMVKREESEMVSVPLNDIVRQVVSLFHSEAIIRDIRVEIFLTEDLPNVTIDIVLIQQVLTNLMMNAAESMIQEGRDRKISIRTEAGYGHRVRVAVSDTGTGIEEKDVGKIFDPFFTTKRSGLGMGLSLSHSIIEAHGGRMGVESNTGRGATFYFDLPAGKGA